jgi:predicted RNA binding protein YcfA (HicA-like mRNA interferase family)
MPKKIRELIQALKSAGFCESSGKGSHRKFSHVKCRDGVTLSGNPGADARDYQEKQVVQALKEVKHEEK